MDHRGEEREGGRGGERGEEESNGRRGRKVKVQEREIEMEQECERRKEVTPSLFSIKISTSDFQPGTCILFNDGL